MKSLLLLNIHLITKAYENIELHCGDANCIRYRR